MTIDPKETVDDYPYYEATVTESSLHYKAIEYIHAVLQARYAEVRDVFVGANNFVYWQEGKKNRKQAPDVYVCFGAQNIDRRSYKTWEEGGIAPQVIFEITSDSSRFTDVGTKKAVYELWGVEEYYLFDPLREYIPKGLQAFFNEQGTLQARSGKRIHSPRLGLDLRAEGKLLRLFLPGSSQRLPAYGELLGAQQAAEAARQAAEAARQAAEAARQAAETRAAELEQELTALKRRLDEK